MGFSWLRFASYRNLEDRELAVAAPEVFLVGDNGQGKTNLLEAVYLLCYGNAFRDCHEADLPKKGEDAFALEAGYEHGGARGVQGYSGSTLLRYECGKKAMFLDGKPLRDRKELVERIPSIVFTHEDMEFAKGSPERRRWFFDQTISLYDQEYIDRLRAYKKILKSRNQLLRERNAALLEIVDEQAVEAGLLVRERRELAAREFNDTFGDLFGLVSESEERLSLRYLPSWKGTREEILESLCARRESEYQMATSLSGPHRDRYEYDRQGQPFSRTASTGQLRLLSLTLRVAQALFYTKKTGRLPILLLDDVLLELDPGKRTRFIRNLPAYDQAFFTFLPGEPYDAYRSGQTKVYFVSDGRFTDTPDI
jgi:DNA replication and repair protein RecF